MNAFDLPHQRSPRRLGVVALVLFVLYGTIVSGAALPLQLLDPTWQLRFSAALVNAAGFPLVGLSLLHLGAELAPADRRLAGRSQLCARLAIGAALGFLLLAPLQAAALWQNQASTDAAQGKKILRAETKLTALRQAVQSANSSIDLRDRLSGLQGPSLGPTELGQPLSDLKAQLSLSLDQAATEIARQRQLLAPAYPWRLLGETLRNAVACFALAFGFAALATRRGSQYSLLHEWQLSWQRLSQRRPSFGFNKRETEDKAYIRQISAEDEEKS